MDATGVKLLNLMFREGETICVSHTKYAYHSVSQLDVQQDKVALSPADENRAVELVDTNLLQLVSLNPISGIRNDANCTAFRNFLVEMDYGPLDQQLAYAKQIGLPYSAVIFSGSKSLHFLISLDKDVPNEGVWRLLAEWILNCAPMADDKTKNPSRGIRIPGGIREPGKIQRLEEFKGPIKLDDLHKWLMKHPDAKPVRQPLRASLKEPTFEWLKPWAKNALKYGIDPKKGRNQQWFALAVEFAIAGFSEEETIEILATKFVPDRDFKEREWKTSIRSGFKYAHENRK